MKNKLPLGGKFVTILFSYMSENKGEVVQGVVVEALPNTLFRVEIKGQEKPVLAYLAGKMRMHRIKVLIGDKVELLIDPYGGKARITRRF